MRPIFLARFCAALLTIPCIIGLLVTIVDPVTREWLSIQAIMIAAALTALLASLWMGRFEKSHWFNQPNAVWPSLFGVAVVGTCIFAQVIGR